MMGTWRSESGGFYLEFLAKQPPPRQLLDKVKQSPSDYSLTNKGYAVLPDGWGRNITDRITNLEFNLIVKIVWHNFCSIWLGIALAMLVGKE